MQNTNLENYIYQYKIIFESAQNSYIWQLPVCEKTGKVDKSYRWTLNDLTASTTAAKLYLNNFSSYEGYALESNVIGAEWIELIKAEVSRRCFDRKQSPLTILPVISALRLIASVSGKSIHEVSSQDIQDAYEVALKIQPSGLLAGRVVDLSKALFDTYNLSKYCPIKISVQRENKNPGYRKTHAQLSNINQRLNEDKLPGADEFKVLVEILSSPHKRDIDRVLFPAIKLLVALGLRVNEVCCIPVDWKIEETHYDQNGNISRNKNGEPLKTLYLRYFAEKQGEKELYEPRRVPIPMTFAEHMEEELDKVVELTASLREKLVFQEKHGNSKLFPNYSSSEFIGLETFVRHVSAVTDEVKENTGAGHHLYVPRFRILKKYNVPRYEALTGRLIPWDLRTPINEESYQISAVEKALRKHFKTKLSDISPIVSIAGKPSLKASEALFLLPRRAKAKQSESGWYYDWDSYLFVTPIKPVNLQKALVGTGEAQNIFSIYLGKLLKLNPHSLRHLRSTELFRAQVSDMVHAKTMGRQSLAQNYEYDHRTVKEKLDELDVTDDLLNLMPPNAKITLEKIAAGELGGTIAHTFKSIQKKEGAESAVQWLSAQADAMHITPYGVCVANMISNPCPKHLQCFDNCSHFVADGRPDSQASLQQLRQRNVTVLDEMKLKEQVGNLPHHIQHTQNIIDGIDKALQAQPLKYVFNAGVDKFKDIAEPQGSSILDHPIQTELSI